MKEIGYYKDIPVVACSAKELKSNASFGWDNLKYYLVENKYMVLIDEDGDAMAFGQREPNGSIFEYAEPSCYCKFKGKKSKNVYKEVHEEEECPIHVDAEYNVEELTEVDLYKLSDPIDKYLAEASKKIAYQDVLFIG